MFETTIVPRVSETDGAGHINNTTVPVWLEAGRRGVFAILTPDLSFARWRATVVSTTIDYLDQLYLAEEAVVRVWVERVGTRSFTLDEEIWQGGRHCVRARTVYVYFDPDVGRALPVPDDVCVALEAHRREA
ncbi:MAG: acyl-CoA thioesterase [Paracoccaceae bacterium]